MLHCEVLQLPCTFYWLWIWLVWHGRDWSVVLVVIKCDTLCFGTVLDLGLQTRDCFAHVFQSCLLTGWTKDVKTDSRAGLLMLHPMSRENLVVFPLTFCQAPL